MATRVPEDKPKTGLIVGLIIGAIVLIVIIVIIIVLLRRRAANNDNSGPSGCTSDANCAGSTICNTLTGFCVQCLNDSNCGSSESCGPNGFCIPATCNTDADCNETNPVCNTTSKTCVECTATNSTGCIGNTNVCNDTSGKCVQCLDLNDCPPNYTCDSNNFTCIPPQCISDANCFGNIPKCDQNTGTCVGCVINADCTSNSCNANLTCDCTIPITPAVSTVNAIDPVNQRLNLSWIANPTVEETRIVVSRNANMAFPYNTVTVTPTTSSASLSPSQLGVPGPGLGVSGRFFTDRNYYVQIEQVDGVLANDPCYLKGDIVTVPFLCQDFYVIPEFTVNSGANNTLIFTFLNATPSSTFNAIIYLSFNVNGLDEEDGQIAFGKQFTFTGPGPFILNKIGGGAQGFDVGSLLLNLYDFSATFSMITLAAGSTCWSALSNHVNIT